MFASSDLRKYHPEIMIITNILIQTKTIKMQMDDINQITMEPKEDYDDS